MNILYLQTFALKNTAFEIGLNFRDELYLYICGTQSENQIFMSAILSPRPLIFLIFSILVLSLSAQKIHTTYLWHMDQPDYWADKSIDKPDSKQYAEES